LFAPHDAASVMRLDSEGLGHKLYYLHPRQTIGKEFADCTREVSSGAENIARRPSLRLSQHSNGLTHPWVDAVTLLAKLKGIQVGTLFVDLYSFLAFMLT